jgi:hypothetical protein
MADWALAMRWAKTEGEAVIAVPFGKGVGAWMWRKPAIVITDPVPHGFAGQRGYYSRRTPGK